jgi:hypothetical protein
LAATLALGFLILSIAIYQVSVIPAETAQTEYEHSTTVREQFVDLSDSITTAATDGTTAPSTVSLGTEFPYRPGFVGPQRSSGSLETVGLGAVTIENASYPDSENPDREYNTTGIRYSPSYSQYDVGAETWLEHGVAVRRTGSGRGVGLSDQRLVDGSYLSLTVLNGTLSESETGPVTVPNRPVSVDETTVELTQNGSGPITVVAPTRLNESTWNRLLAAERTPKGNITAISVVERAGSETDELRMRLANGSYELDVASVAVGSGVAEPETAYLSAVTQNQTVREGSTVPVSVQVRDRYDNPVSGVRLDYSVDCAQSLPIRSDERGIATCEYEASGSGSTEITVSVDGSPDIDTRIEFNIVS